MSKEENEIKLMIYGGVIIHVISEINIPSNILIEQNAYQILKYLGSCIHTYMHTDRQTDRQTYIHTF